MESELSLSTLLIVVIALSVVFLLWYFFIYKLDKELQQHKLKTIEKKLERIRQRKLKQQNSKSDSE